MDGVAQCAQLIGSLVDSSDELLTHHEGLVVKIESLCHLLALLKVLHGLVRALAEGLGGQF